jgi:hypothetical protein
MPGPKGKGSKGQSSAEFALIIPFFILVSLGLAQLCLITTAAVLLKYTAFMTARVAAASDQHGRQESASSEASVILDAMASRSLFNAGLLTLFTGSGVDIKEEKMNSAVSPYIRVTVRYNFPLKVPFVNRIFGMSKGLSDPAAFAAGMAGMPYFPLKASCVMMVQ